MSGCYLGSALRTPNVPSDARIKAPACSGGKVPKKNPVIAHKNVMTATRYVRFPLSMFIFPLSGTSIISLYTNCGEVIPRTQ